LPNVFEKKIEETPVEERKPIHQSDIVNKAIKQRHCEAWLVFSGLEKNLPSGNSEVKVFFCTDSGKLKIWNGSAWLSTTLS